MVIFQPVDILSHVPSQSSTRFPRKEEADSVGLSPILQPSTLVDIHFCTKHLRILTEIKGSFFYSLKTKYRLDRWTDRQQTRAHVHVHTRTYTQR